MKFADYLSKEDIRKFNQLRRAARNKKEHKPVVTKPQLKKKENLSSRDLKELMGTNMATYKRVNGAVRRK